MKTVLEKHVSILGKLTQKTTNIKNKLNYYLTEEDYNNLNNDINNLMNMLNQNTPDTPDTPDNPDIPDTPDNPDIPDTPTQPEKTPVFNITIIKSQVPDVPEFSIQNGLATTPGLGDYYDTGQMHEYTVAGWENNMQVEDIIKYAKKYIHESGNIIAYWNEGDSLMYTIPHLAIENVNGTKYFSYYCEFNVNTAQSGDEFTFVDESPYTYQIKMY